MAAPARRPAPLVMTIVEYHGRTRPELPEPTGLQLVAQQLRRYPDHGPYPPCTVGAYLAALRALRAA